MTNFKERFTPTNNDLSYYPLLYLALEETKTGDVIEMGTGYGSTPLLHEYCTKRELYSYENNKEWYYKMAEALSVLSKTGKHTSSFLNDKHTWDVVSYYHDNPTVVFIDHAPGERRKEDILNFKDIKGILVVHDTEPAADHGYQMRQHFKEFKYVIEVETDGAWATALSNHIDVTKWKGQTFGKYIVG